MGLDGVKRRAPIGSLVDSKSHNGWRRANKVWVTGVRHVICLVAWVFEGVTLDVDANVFEREAGVSLGVLEPRVGVVLVFKALLSRAK